MARDSQSVLDRSAPEPDFAVIYGDHPDHVADVWVPAEAPRGLVIFLHGGFWRQTFDRRHARPLAVALARAGFVAVTPEYRRTGAPGGGWPGTLNDVAAAVALLPGLISQRLGGDPGGLVLTGHSAGGHLALWAAAKLTKEAKARGVVALAPVADLALAYQRDLGGGAVAALLGGGPHEVPERYAVADPMALVPLGVPVVLGHGGRDDIVPVEISHRFAAVARAAGDDVTVLEWPRVDHFEVIDPESVIWPEIMAAIRRF